MATIQVGGINAQSAPSAIFARGLEGYRPKEQSNGTPYFVS